MLITHCPECDRRAREESREVIIDTTLITLKCGHKVYETNLAHSKTERDWHYEQLRHYQQEGLEFIEESNYNCLLADDMGLGKTVQVLAAIRYNKDKLTPTLIIAKSSLRYQWAGEVYKWLYHGDQFPTNGATPKDPKDLPYIIKKGGQHLFPGFNFYIISMDLLPKYVKELKALGFQLVIVDESQNFKARDTQRTQALTEIVKEIPHRVCLSGTPILNRASEYYTTLNLIAPMKFYNETAFNRQWVETLWNGQGGGIIHWKQDAWKQSTKDIIIRRMRSEVLKDLPPLQRTYTAVQITDPIFIREYNRTRKELGEYLVTAINAGKLEQYSHILALLSKLRQISGVAKVEAALEWIKDYLDSNDRKLTVGIHHKIVGEQLELALAPYHPLRLEGGLDERTKRARIKQFSEQSESRILIASTLAAGEGTDGLQYCCSDMLILERQWNIMKEEQFEGRLLRYGQKEPVFVYYFLAKGSIDEWLTELTEDKRGYVKSAVAQDEKLATNDFGSTDYMVLAEMAASRGLG
jgi:SNF2 family DNA or RNA helicase